MTMVHAETTVDGRGAMITVYRRAAVRARDLRRSPRRCTRWSWHRIDHGRMRTSWSQTTPI